MKIKAFDTFKVSKKNKYEKLPIDDGVYLVLGIGDYHGMSVSDNDYFNTNPIGKARKVLLLHCNGALISTKPFGVSVDDINELITEGYIEEIKKEYFED